VRLLDFEFERRRVEVQREIVLIADQVVDSRHIIAPSLDEHAGPVERLGGDDRRAAVAACDLPTRDDGLE